MARSLPDRVRAHAQSAPERVAITIGSRNCTYGQLWRQILLFADWLQRSGFKPGDRLAIVLANCPEAVIACYGAWMAGGIAVPLNAQARPRELEPWLRHADPAALIHDSANLEIESLLQATSNPLLRAVVGKQTAVPSFDEVVASRDKLADPIFNFEVDDAAAMIVFTSGTTGGPKGVTLSHRNLASNTDSVVRYLELTAADSVVSVLPFYYSYGNSVLHTHLAAGARIVLELNIVFPHAVVATIARERVTGFAGVPSTFALLLSSRLDRYDLSSLRYLTQAGGPMSVATTQRLPARAAAAGAAVRDVRADRGHCAADLSAARDARAQDSVRSA